MRSRQQSALLCRGAGAAGVQSWLPHPLRAACGAAGGRGHTGPEKAGFLPDEALFARLMELDGVGKKVANCVSVRLWPCGPCAGGCLDRTAHPGRVCRQDPFPQFGLEAGIVQQYLFFL